MMTLFVLALLLVSILVLILGIEKKFHMRAARVVIKR